MSVHPRDPFPVSTDLLASAGTPSSFAKRVSILLTVWRDRIQERRRLAAVDGRSLRDAGISPGIAAFEANKPFWKPMGELR